MEKEAKLKLIAKNEKFGEKLSEVFSEQFESDDERPKKRGRYMAKAILENNLDDLLIAICGWSSESLVNMALYNDPYPPENAEPSGIGITEKLVTDGYKQGVIRLEINDEEWYGIAAMVGDLDWFYFDYNLARKAKTVEEYISSVPEKTIISRITDALNEIDEEEYLEYLKTHVVETENKEERK